ARLCPHRGLAGRFRCNPDDLPARLREVERQLAEIERDDDDLAGLDAPLADAWGRVRSAADALSAARRRATRAFATAVRGQLRALSLGGARLTVEVETRPLGDDPTAAPPPEDGADRVEILFAPNPGEPPRPLRKIASGGELSRVTLAIKTVLAGA